MKNSDFSEKTIKRRSVHPDSEHELDYKLTVSKTSDNKEFTESYSISIKKIDKSVDVVEDKTVRDFTRIHSFAEKMYELISLNSVTPVTLADIITDFISDY